MTNLFHTIYLAGGCFWGVERLYRQLPGVLNVTAGYANGDSREHANYASVCTGITGFREAVKVEYDDTLVPLEHLLFAFFAVIDPEMSNRQGMDFGTQYQTGVYWSDDAQEKTVRRIFALEEAQLPIFAVECGPIQCFYPAEEFHQRYLEKNPGGYCHISRRRISALARYPVESYDSPAKDRLRAFLAAEETE